MRASDAIMLPHGRLRRALAGAAAVVALALLAAALGPAPVAAGDEAAPEVHWAGGPWKDVLARAKRQNRPIFVDFYATWCGPCKRLEKVTYRDPKVVELLNSIVPVKYDAEKGEGETLAKKFRVRAYPTLVVLDPSGREVDRFLGYMDPEPFRKAVEDAIAGRGTIAALEAKWREHPDDVDVMRRLGRKYVDAGRAEDAARVYDKLLARNDVPDTERMKILASLGDAEMGSDLAERARGRFLEILRRWPAGPLGDLALQRLAVLAYRQQQPDTAVARYRTLLRRHPDDPSTLNGFAWFCARRSLALDEALEAARRAVEKSGGDPGILDTLAEVHFARGEYDEAIRVEKEALAKEPDDQYLHDQIERFEKARREAKEQAKK